MSSVVQIFGTGLTPPPGWKITAKLHDRQIDEPYYAGPAPGLTGVQQVNITVPADLPAMTTEVLVCASSQSGDQRICSAPVKITLSTPTPPNEDGASVLPLPFIEPAQVLARASVPLA